MFLKTLMTSLLSALALTTPGTVADQGANSNQVDLPRGNAVDSYVPMSTNTELDMYDALKGGEQGKNAEYLKGETYSGECGTNVTWNLDTSTGLLNISGNGEMCSYTSYDSYPWYSYRSQIKKVVISKGVTSIGDYAFYGCESLSSVTISSDPKLTSIGNAAFRECTSLSSIEIPSNVTSIGEFAFVCTSLSSIEIPSSVTSIGDEAFSGCSKLSSVTISSDSKLTSIGNAAFEGCTSLSSIEIPSSVTSIGDYAFYYCTSLSSIEIPSSVTSIGKSAFYYCTSLSDVKYCGESEISSTNVFGSCDKLGVVQVPTDYSYDSFCGVSVSKVLDDKCEVIVDPEESSSSQVVPDPANNCEGTNYRWYGDTLIIGGTGEMCSINSGSYPWASYSSKAKNIIIDEGVTSISEHAFEGFTNLETLVIPESVKRIDSQAFRGCIKLNDVKYCGYHNIASEGSVFDGCVSLAKVAVPEKYEGKEFCGKYVDKKLDDKCEPIKRPDNSAGRTGILSTAIGVTTAALMMNNRRYMQY